MSHVAQVVLMREGLANYLLRYLLFTCLVGFAYHKFFPSCVFGNLIMGASFDALLLQQSLREIQHFEVDHLWHLQHSGR